MPGIRSSLKLLKNTLARKKQPLAAFLGGNLLGTQRSTVGFRGRNFFLLLLY